MTNVAKHEDAVMKMGFDYFRDTILRTLNTTMNLLMVHQQK